MMELITKVETKFFTNNLQEQLNEDRQQIRASKEVIIPADKTGNFYQLEPKEYKKTLANTVTKDYMKVEAMELEKINTEAASIAKKLKLDDRIDAMGLNQSYVTVKDHKPSFPNSLECRIINPCKSQIGRISKKILEDINTRVRESTRVCQWRSTDEVVKWFNGLRDKKKLCFIQCDIQAFYPSINKDLLIRAINHAKKVTLITEEEINIIMHARRSLLASGEDVWMKKDCPEFDVTMGAYDASEVAELVGLYLLHRMEEIQTKEFNGLYRDDGLHVVEGGGQEAERIKKKLFAMYKSEGLKVTAEANLKIVQFLDVTFDLRDGSFKPFMKPNTQLRYVSRESNHPPLILSNIPEGINKRLDRISSSRQKFEEEKTVYQKALDEAGYHHKLIYREHMVEETQGPAKRKRCRKVLWFNPPFSANIKTNIGKRFFGILMKHFPEGSELAKIFNKKTVKLSYCCMPNMKSIISGHNKKILRGEKPAYPVKKDCNCRGGVPTCPLEGKCQTKSLVYKAEVTTREGMKEYLGQASNTFKFRYNGHTDSFRNEHKEKDTTLSKYLWQLKRREEEHEIKWYIASLAIPYTRETKRCQLCNMEKTLIACQDSAKALNRRWEIMTRCRHRDKDLLTNWFQSQLTLPLAEPYQVDGAEPQPGAQVEDQPHPVQPDQEPQPQPQEEHRADSVEDVPLFDGRQEGGGPVTRSRARTRLRERSQR